MNKEKLIKLINDLFECINIYELRKIEIKGNKIKISYTDSEYPNICCNETLEYKNTEGDEE